MLSALSALSMVCVCACVCVWEGGLMVLEFKVKAVANLVVGEGDVVFVDSASRLQSYSVWVDSCLC